MHDTQFRLLLEFFDKIAASLARLVAIQNLRLISEQKHMTIDDALLQQILDAGNAALNADASDRAASAAKDATILNLQAQLAPNPALAAAAAQFLNAALAANPPGAPVTPVTPPATDPVATDPAAPVDTDPATPVDPAAPIFTPAP